MRSLIGGASLALALALLCGQSAIASAGPPDDAARRAEEAAEKAQKAAERAAEAAQRAAERAERDAAELAERQLEAANREQRAFDKAAEDLARDLAQQEEKTREAAAKAAEDLAQKEGSDQEGKTASDGEQLASSSGTSGSSSPDTESTSNSGSGSSNSGEDGGDGDDHDDDQQGVLQASRGDKLDRDEFGNLFRTDELVILSDDATVIDRARARGFLILETSRLDLVGSVLVRVRRPDDLSSPEALQILRANEPAAASGYNYVYDLSGPPASAPKVPAPGMSVARGSSGSATVGVVDGFAADSVGGWKVERLVAGPARIGHGDAVTAIILDDLKGYDAPAPNLLLIDVVPGTGQADVAAIIVSLDKLVARHATYANISLAGPDHPALKLAIARTQKLGLTIIAAVGNAGPAAPPAFPAAYDGVIGVSAVDHLGQPYVYSARGSQVDVAAPGVDELVPGSLVPLSGTSYATPHVTAFLAARRPDAAGPPAEQVLVSAAQDVGAPGRDAVFGMGILDPGHALAVPNKTRLASADLPPGQ